MSVKLMINGRPRTFSGDPRTPLLDVIRDNYRLTGSKAVCREGFCGSCTVYVDGAPTASCLQPIGALDGTEVTTIEGIGSVEKLNPVQQVLEDSDVVQCGMCFPGLVMTMTSFLEKNPTPSRMEVKYAMIGNICRCTGYERIIDAVMSLQTNLERNEEQV